MKPRPHVFGKEHAAGCELAAETLRTAGKLRLRVTGWSMFPSVRPRDVLMVERVDCDGVGCGDIVLFERDGRLFAHRVLSRSGAKIVTRGDAMGRADAPIGEKEFLGKVTSIVRQGERMEARRTRRVSERAVSAAMRGSEVAARVVAGWHARNA